MDPFGGRKPTDNAIDRRRQRLDVRRRMQSKPPTRPIDAFKNAITSIRQRILSTTTTPAPTTVANRRQKAGRTRRIKSGRSPAGMVAAPLATSSTPPPAPAPAPINCAECRRLCNVRGRARSRPLGGSRRSGKDPVVASVASADEGIVASAGPAAATPFGNFWSYFIGNPDSDGMVASSGPADEGGKMWDNLVKFFTPPDDGMVSSAKDQDAWAPNFWHVFRPEQSDNVGAARRYGDENLPYCEDITG
uniref:Uncharacterized protein n=1 Tax=Anopheles culicifacies TaxID=139723 RepID=A0A182M5K9_9DIPT